MEKELIAPCGMNCAVCSGYLALKNDVKSKGVKMAYCKGCRARDKKCAWLKKRCELLMDKKIDFCYECNDFPCDNLKRLDKNYRKNYQMSFIEHLEFIRDNGAEKFLKEQEKKWKCPNCGDTICCHNHICFSCNLDELKRKNANRYGKIEK